MEIFSRKSELEAYLQALRTAGKTVALVPTMGALHAGHLSLVQRAKKAADIVVCSIFVNPTQFNDPSDLEKYPRPIENDIALLTSENCDILFLPEVSEMYSDPNEKWHIDLGDLDQIWEGAQRPGHFQGVTQIVYKLFSLVMPDMACFGQKDFQQVMVIQYMIDQKHLPILLIVCPIIRNTEGLALSSRNSRLSEQAKADALVLFRALSQISENFNEKTFTDLRADATALIQAQQNMKLEYLAICETRTLHEAVTKEEGKSYVALVVAWIDGVRLIDNMLLNN